MAPDRVRKGPSLAQRSSGAQPMKRQPRCVMSAKRAEGSWVEVAAGAVLVAATVLVTSVVAVVVG